MCVVVLSKMGSFQWPELCADSFKLLHKSLVQEYVGSVEAQEKSPQWDLTENWNTRQNKIKLVSQHELWLILVIIQFHDSASTATAVTFYSPLRLLSPLQGLYCPAASAYCFLGYLIFKLPKKKDGAEGTHHLKDRATGLFLGQATV